MRLIGIDPGLQRTGWGVVEAAGNRLSAVASGVVTSTQTATMAERLVELFEGLTQIVRTWAPVEAAVEETFVNTNPASTLKLGQARAVGLLVPGLAGLPVHEYSATAIKLALVGQGRADKAQVAAMVRRLLPGAVADGDAADALAIAICHAHHSQVRRAWAGAGAREAVR